MWGGRMAEGRARVGLFVTCLVDLFRPTVGFAAVKLLEAAGCTVEVPRAQTCCGQPAYNSGDRPHAKAIASQVIDAFAEYDHVVAPSGSCAGMIRVHYPEMFADDPVMLPRLAGSWPGFVFTGEPLRLPAGHFGMGHGNGAHAPDEYYLIESSNPKVAGMDDAVRAHVEFLYEVARTA